MNKLLIIPFLFLVGCYPTVSLQNASLIPQKKSEIITSFSLSPYFAVPQIKHFYGGYSLGVSWTYGICDKLNLHSQYLFIQTPLEYTDQFHKFIVGMKTKIVEDKLAVYLPISFMLSTKDRDYNTFLLEPTLIYSKDLRDKLTLNSGTSIKADFSRRLYSLSTAVGIDIETKSENIIIKPEFSILVYPFMKELIYNATIAFSFKN